MCIIFYFILNYAILRFQKSIDTLWLIFNLWVKFSPGANFYKDDRNKDKSLNVVDQTLPLQCNPEWQGNNNFRDLKETLNLFFRKHYISEVYLSLEIHISHALNSIYCLGISISFCMSSCFSSKSPFFYSKIKGRFHFCRGQIKP